MKKEKQECKHKWIPNGITKKEIWSGEDCSANPRKKWGEIVMASCICEKCGKIKIKEDKL